MAFRICHSKRLFVALSDFESTFQSHMKRAASQANVANFKVVEVGARDGLQNEKRIIPTATKVTLIERLVECGLRSVEATSFVSPKWVPQMADHKEVMSQLRKRADVSYSVLVPNMAGLNSAISAASVKEIAVFAAASESFSRKNTNCSISEGVKRGVEVARAARAAGLAVRGYVSCVIGCPYDGAIDPRVVVDVTQRLLDAGCYEVSLGDTIGVGNAGTVRRLIDALIAASLPANKLAVHFHDTYGQALSNVLVAIDKGITVADSSVAGLGGCPYAKGATGNIATEDLVYMLNGLGLHTGIDLERLIDVGDWICAEMNRENGSKVAKAMRAKSIR